MPKIKIVFEMNLSKEEWEYYESTDSSGRLEIIETGLALRDQGQPSIDHLT